MGDEVLTVEQAASLQKEMSERVYRMQCDKCETKSYAQAHAEGMETLNLGETLGEWDHSTTYAALVRRCADCAMERTRPWIMDIAPEAFRDFMNAQQEAFEYEVLRGLPKKNG